MTMTRAYVVDSSNADLQGSPGPITAQTITVMVIALAVFGSIVTVIYQVGRRRHGNQQAQRHLRGYPTGRGSWEHLLPPDNISVVEVERPAPPYTPRPPPPAYLHNYPPEPPPYLMPRERVNTTMVAIPAPTQPDTNRVAR
ncbi:hypothetical protein CERSUDRAFT_111927 [Gelatoporia subvermispora B]|uniref:Uncharacterized protein n=1 Tax=Ceriporiopsis subvermispora (strain B) TaxID=914234 RepID=M2PSH8_CERS8|nr:hypothetical protein CERSUDRAFT_111927 [Gelatoporia subvermispora B]